MDRFDISSPTPLSDAVSVNVKRVQKDEYNLVLPLSLCFGPSKERSASTFYKEAY